MTQTINVFCGGSTISVVFFSLLRFLEPNICMCDSVVIWILGKNVCTNVGLSLSRSLLSGISCSLSGSCGCSKFCYLVIFFRKLDFSIRDLVTLYDTHFILPLGGGIKTVNWLCSNPFYQILASIQNLPAWLHSLVTL